jgi:uncharacterized protein YjbJ (UPF0337 family)
MALHALAQELDRFCLCLEQLRGPLARGRRGAELHQGRRRKVQETTGKVIGSNEQQRKGIKKQVDGQARKAVGDIEEVVKDVSKK